LRFTVPHPIPYQGSKRRLAAAILSHVPDGRYKRLVEPFAGSAAVTLAAAYHSKFRTYVIGDRLEPLAQLWQNVIDDPTETANKYESLWLRERERPIDVYYEIRSEFNHPR
jgi:DNA adenine methylase